jgi:hypothetical protein
LRKTVHLHNSVTWPKLKRARIFKRVRVRGLQFVYRVELHAPAEENNPTNVKLLKGKGNEVKGKG